MNTATSSTNTQSFIDVRVRQIRAEADGVISIEMAPDHGLLPAYEPGAHLDIMLPSGLIRQYSLCSPPADRSFYRIAVLREAAGRGGSSELHDSALVGKQVKIRGPRNYFPMEPSPRYSFIAGGIGITPILGMVKRAERENTSYELTYLGRRLATMPFRDRLLAGPHIDVVVTSESGRPDLAGLVARADRDTLIYACGPAAMLEAVEDACRAAGKFGQLRTERFDSDGQAAVESATGTAFEVELAKSGKVLTVGENEGLLDVIEPHCDVMTSCEEGFCGTCETRVLEGIPDHHDSILSEKERESNKTMMVCVGRSKSSRLTLDL